MVNNELGNIQCVGGGSSSIFLNAFVIKTEIDSLNVWNKTSRTLFYHRRSAVKKSADHSQAGRNPENPKTFMREKLISSEFNERFSFHLVVGQDFLCVKNSRRFLIFFRVSLTSWTIVKQVDKQRKWSLLIGRITNSM